MTTQTSGCQLRNFKADLERGLQGQIAFMRLFANLTASDGKRGDLTCPDGHKIELKTDSYDANKTANFFIERYSSIERGSPGGPWQAAQHGCKYFVYYFSLNQRGYVFAVDDLLKQLTAVESKLTPVNIRNKSWTTVGYKVPRSSLQPIAEFGPKVAVLPEYEDLLQNWGYLHNLDELAD